MHESSVSRLTVGSRLLWNRGCNELWPCGLRSGPRVVGRTIVGKGSAFSGVWAAWRAPFLFLIQKMPAIVPDSEAFNSLIGDGFRVPELNGGSEASDGDQAVARHRVAWVR